MTSTLMRRQVNPIQLPPILKPILGLTLAHNAQISLCIHIRAQGMINDARAPHRKLQFMVRIVRRSVEDVNLSRSRYTNVAILEVAVDEAWFDRASILRQRVEESGYHGGVQAFGVVLEVVPGPA